MQTPDGDPGITFLNSTDGTSLACHHQGSGPPLLFVYGALADQTYWRALLPFLRDNFSLHILERRGRGASGDTQPYAAEREVEDVVAAVEHIGQPCNLFGHSSGAILALEAARSTQLVRRLLLYETPVDTSGTGEPTLQAGLKQTLERILAQGDRDQAVETFLRDAFGAPAPAIEKLKGSPRWPDHVALAHTMLYDATVVSHFNGGEIDLADFATPTQLILGGSSPREDASGTKILAAALPDSRLSVLEGEGHNGVYTAPERVAAIVRDFCALK